MKKFKNSNAITLVALVITIIVLLIIAGVSLSLILGEDGITQRAINSGKTQNIARAKEELELDIANYGSEFYQAKYINGDPNTTSIQGYIMNKFDTRFPNGQPGAYNDSYTLTVNKNENQLTLKASTGSDRTTETATIETDGKVTWSGTIVASVVTVEVTVSSENTEYGNVNTIVNGTYEEGTKIELIAMPAKGYELDGWYIGSTKQTLDSEGKYTVPTGGKASIALVAKFKQVFKYGTTAKLGIVTVDDKALENEWNYFYDDETNIYLIYGNYLENSQIPTSGSYGIAKDGYNVYIKNTKNHRDNLISYLSNSSTSTSGVWSKIALGVQDALLAKGINVAVKATGAPTVEQFVASYNTDNPSELFDSKYLNSHEYLNGTSGTRANVDGYVFKRSYPGTFGWSTYLLTTNSILYFPVTIKTKDSNSYTSQNYDTQGYWLARLFC